MYVGLVMLTCILLYLQILAKELVGQLQVLENNAHPFYKPKLFVVSLSCLVCLFVCF